MAGTNEIRLATREDLPRIVEIYNQAVNKNRTADMDELSVAEREPWFRDHVSKFPIFLSQVAGRVTGWVSISPYREGRRALSGAVEISYYVDYNNHGSGVGSALMQAGIQHCEEAGFETVFAILLEDNIPSIALLKKFGFELWGLLPGIANFDGRRVGQVYYGLQLPTEGSRKSVSKA